MPDEKDQHEPRDDIEARDETAPEPMEPAPRGNVLSEPDEKSLPGAMPPPLKH